MLRTILFAALPLTLLACSSGGEGEEGKAAQNAQPPQPSPTGPPPKTPVMQVTPAAGASPAWLGPQPGVNGDAVAPYGNLNDEPVVNAVPAQ